MEKSVATRPRLSRHVRLIWDSVRQRHALLIPEAVVVLNETAVSIVELCDGTRTIADIVADLGKRYNGVKPEEVEQFLNGMVARGWIEDGHA